MKRLFFISFMLSLFLTQPYSLLADDLANALIYFAGVGDIPKIDYLVTVKRIDPNLRSDTGVTALWAASRNGHLKVVQLLVKAGAEIDSRSFNGETALIAAAGNGHTAIVKLLIQSGADYSLKDGFGWTALKHSSVAEHYDTYRYLRGYNAVLRVQAYLFAEASAGNPQGVRRALTIGANVNYLGRLPFTPLMAAAENGHIKTARALIDHGADVNLANKKGLTALHCAAHSGRTKMVELLLENGASTQPRPGTRAAAELASDNGFADIVALLHEKRAQEDLAARNAEEYHAIIRELIDLRRGKYSDLAQADRLQIIRLFARASEVQPDPLFDLDLTLFSDFSLVEPEDKLKPPAFTTLMDAVLRGRLQDMMRILQLSSDDINARNGIGETALLLCAFPLAVQHRAANRIITRFSDRPDPCELVKLLVEKGADINATDIRGYTLLIKAAAYGDLPLLTLLLANGADISPRTVSGETALDMAHKFNHKRVMMALQAKSSVR